MTGFVSCEKLEAELAEKQDKLLNCAGSPIPADTRIPTCAEMKDELDKKLDKPTGGTDGQVLTIQPDGSAAWETPTGGGSTELADGVTILGTGTSADKFRVARPIPSGGTSGQVPALKPDGTLEWITPSAGGIDLATGAEYPATGDTQATTPDYVAAAIAASRTGWYFRAQI